MTISASSAERYLREWHTRHPDSGRAFLEHADRDAPTSLDRLAAIAPDASLILDVGCGSGVLLRLLGRANPSAIAIGLDVNLAELRVAADQAPRSTLICARAQKIPLADAAVDRVVSHMALMLMDQPDLVLGEIRRILRTNGVFSAVVQRSASLDPVARKVFGALRSARDRIEAALPPALGDARTMDAVGLKMLASEHFPHCAVEAFELAQSVPRSELWPFLRQRFYGLDGVPQMEAEQLLAEVELPDPVPWSTPMLHLTVGMFS